MFLLKLSIQLISIYRAVAMFIFITFYTIIPKELNSLLLITAVLSDFLDGYLARKFKLTTIGGKLLDLFSDKYLNCIAIIFLIIEHYELLPLVLILAKEIFILSFRSIEIEGNFIIATNRFLGGMLSGTLWLAVFLHINYNSFLVTNIIVTILGISSIVYLIYKIVSNFSNLKKVFKS